MGKGKFHRETMSKKKALRFIFLISFECQAENLAVAAMPILHV